MRGGGCIVYIDRVARKLFSVEAIEDHSAEWLADPEPLNARGELRLTLTAALETRPTTLRTV